MCLWPVPLQLGWNCSATNPHFYWQLAYLHNLYITSPICQHSLMIAVCCSPSCWDLICWIYGRQIWHPSAMTLPSEKAPMIARVPVWAMTINFASACYQQANNKPNLVSCSLDVHNDRTYAVPRQQAKASSFKPPLPVSGQVSFSFCFERKWLLSITVLRLLFRWLWTVPNSPVKQLVFSAILKKEYVLYQYRSWLFLKSKLFFKRCVLNRFGSLF